MKYEGVSMRRPLALLATLALLFTLVPAAASAAPSQTGTWIVQLRAGVDPVTAATGLARQHGGSVGFVYRYALNGFSFRGAATAAEALARNPQVAAIEAGADLVGDGQDGIDCNGHGTHVAGTIGGSTYGVAKGVTLVAVRVFGCSGGSTWETIIAGIDWVIGDHANRTPPP